MTDIAMHEDGTFRKVVVATLRDLRIRVEEEAEMTLDEIETSMAMAIVDVCEAFGLGDHQMRQVLGDNARELHEPINCVLLPATMLTTIPILGCSETEGEEAG